MKRFLLSIAFILLALTCFAQKQKVSIVELQNGSVIRGVLLESVEGTVKIQTADQSVFVYQESEVKKITETEQKYKNSVSSFTPCWESSILGTFVASVDKYSPKWNFGVDYILDYRIAKSFFVELGLFASYCYVKPYNEYINNPTDGKESICHNPHIGIPLGFGFNFEIGEHFRITPFLRACGYIGYYSITNNAEKVSSGFNYGFFPDLGLRLSYGPFVLSSSARIYYGVTRFRNPAVSVGLGYRF